MAGDDNKCGHDICLCATTDDAKYCSEHCERAAAQDLTEISCDCGHPDCSL